MINGDLDRIEYGPDRQPYKLSISNGIERSKGEWIDVKDKLPEADNDYLVTYTVTAIKEHYFIDIAYFTGHKWIVDNSIMSGREVNVIAWQRLPKPYTRGEYET